MATIAEIIAAKKAATKGGSVSTPAVTERKTVDGIDYARNALNPEWVAQGPAKKKESIAERIEATEAINRIDPPGKSERATAARKAAGIILNMDLPPAPQDNKLEVPREIIQPADDLPMCIWFDKGTVWLCMPCAVDTMPPIKVMRLPWTVWPIPAVQPLPEGDPF